MLVIYESRLLQNWPNSIIYYNTSYSIPTVNLILCPTFRVTNEHKNMAQYSSWLISDISLLAVCVRVPRLEVKRHRGVVAAVEPPPAQTVASAGSRRNMGFGGFLKRLGTSSSASSSSEYGQASTTVSKPTVGSTAERKETDAAIKAETTAETAASGGIKQPEKMPASVMGASVGRKEAYLGVRSSRGASLGQTGVGEMQRNNDEKLDNDCPSEVVETNERSVDKPSNSSDANRRQEGGEEGGIGVGTVMQRFDLHLNHELSQTVPSYGNDNLSSLMRNPDTSISATNSSGCLVAKAEPAPAAGRDSGGHTQGKTHGGDGDCRLTYNSRIQAGEVVGEEDLQQTQEESNSRDLSPTTANTDQEQQKREEGEKGSRDAEKEHRQEGINNGSECGSLHEGSVHSRWSLPDGGGLGRLQTERAVWRDFDDSLSPCSNAGEERDSAISITPSSRVGSYDMEHDKVI